MEFYLPSDNINTQTRIRPAGVGGAVVHEHHEVLEELGRMMHMESITIVLMATKLIEACPEVISELKLGQGKPLTAEVPDRHSSAKIGKTIDRYISEAIDVKL